MGQKELSYLNEELTITLMKVPTYSKQEDRIKEYIKDFAIEYKIKWEEDTKGNIYLTKGESIIFPCITAHMDSVQNKHIPYIIKNEEIPVKITTVKYKNDESGKTYTKLAGENMGLGCDDKCGIAIALSMILKCDILKCAFFVEEEIGSLGSSKLSFSFFENVGYCIGYDSPDLNRAAHSCSGEQLFTKDFHETQLKDICKKWGVEKFYSEPNTDVCNIRKYIPIQCMNFGSGYYNQHSDVEYCLLEEMDNACGMGIDLVQSLGYKTYEFPCIDDTIPWSQKNYNSEEKTYLRTLGDDDYKLKYEQYYKQNKNNFHNPYNDAYGYGDDDDYSDLYGMYHQGSEFNSQNGDENVFSIEAINFVISAYQDHIDEQKRKVRLKCEELGIDYKDTFGDIFEEPFPIEIDQDSILPF